MKPLVTATLLLVLITLFASYFQNKTHLTTLIINDKQVYCELATNSEERSLGLMYRENLAKDHGMLFIYQDEDYRTYHMKNVYFPLSIAFANAKGEIVSLFDMETDPKKKYPSQKKAQYALEVNKGWFEKNKIKVGDTITGIPMKNDSK